MRRLLLLLAAPLLCAADLDVTVTGVRSDHGQVLVAICDRATFLQEQCAFHGGAPAKTGAVVIRVTGLPPGVYAAQAFQDENGNGKVDTNFFGIPTEGIGFSRDAPMRLGPPRFDDAAFTLDKSGGVTFALKYFR